MPEALFNSDRTDWRVTSLGELCAEGGGNIQTGPFGSQLHSSDYVADGIPSIMPQNIGDNRVIEHGIARITEADAKRLSRYRVKAGDVVYSRRGDIRRRALIRKEHDGWLCGTGCLRVRLGSGDNDASFVSHYLGHPDVMDWIESNAVGSTMPNLNTAILSRLPIVVPPPDEQRAIARVLGVLDDNIELNRLMNRTLEELAAALFRSWFVDFDPVVAKAAGRQPAHLRPDLAALFPAHWQDSPLCQVPQGWSVANIGDVVKVVGGSTPSTNEPKFWSGDIAWATPRDLAALTDPVLIATDRQITAAGLDQIGSGLLPKGTVLLSSRAPIGYTAITDIPVAVNQGFIALICDGPLPSYYVIEWVRENMETIEGRANGTTFMEISKMNFRPIAAVVPPPNVLEKFMGIASPWWRQIIHNVRESRTLAALRDTLLPKLLSGELRVKQAEKLVEATV